MGVILEFWGRFFDTEGNKITVPAPSTDSNAKWLWDLIAEKAADCKLVGFSAIKLPPSAKAQGGDGAGCDGFGVFDPRDLGNKPQQGSINTRYGSLDSLRRAVAVCHAVGMDVYLDLVMHQRIGANAGPGHYKYLGADGKTLNGRGEMTAGCFRGVAPYNNPDDDVPNQYWDFAFGDEVSHQNCHPPGYTIADALDTGNWTFNTLDADGARFDDVKGTWAPFVHLFMVSNSMNNKLFYSEYSAGRDEVAGWANSGVMQRRSMVEDFDLHYAIKAACDYGNVGALNGSGYTAIDPLNSLTFVDSPDTDTNSAQAVINNKLLGYAFLLTVEGYPCVYGKDYFGPDVWPGSYGLKKWIDNLIWIHENLAFGKTITQYIDNNVIVLNRIGEPGLLTAINFDPINAHTITCNTSFGANQPLQEYSGGKHNNIYTNNNGQVTFTIPSNAYGSGQSYLCFSKTNYSQPFKFEPRVTTQKFYGSFDLDIPGAKDGMNVTGKVFAAAGNKIHITVNNSLLTAKVLDETLQEIPTGVAQKDGWVFVGLEGKNIPETENKLPYEVSVTYMAPTKVLEV